MKKPKIYTTIAFILFLLIGFLGSYKNVVALPFSGTGCTFGPAKVIVGFNYMPNSSCYIQGSLLQFGSGAYVGGSFGANITINTFSTTNHGYLGMCQLTGCSNFGSTTLTGSCSTIICHNVSYEKAISMGEQGPMGATGATGATGPQGAQGIQGIPGMDGYNNFELAQIQGFTGDEIQYLASLVGPMGATGATGSLALDLSQSGVIALQNVVTIERDDGDLLLNSGSEYIPISYSHDGTTYIDTTRIVQLIAKVLFFGILFFIFWYYIIKKFKGPRRLP